MPQRNESQEKMQILKTILSAASSYELYLKNRNMLFVYQLDTHTYAYIESVFEARHFHHLTGTKLKNGVKAVDFYERCIDHRLSINDFDLPGDGTAALKMQVIEQLMSLHRTSNMVGVYGGNGVKLYTEKSVGNIRGCMGFVADKDSAYYVPNTILKADIRNEVEKPYRLVAIFMKEIQQESYDTLCHQAKGLDVDKLLQQTSLTEKVDSAHLKKAWGEKG